MNDNIKNSERETFVTKNIENKLKLGDVRSNFKNDVIPFINKDLDNIIKPNMGVVMSSDGFIPFEDNINEAIKPGVSYIANPGDINDNKIIDLCNENNINMFNTGLRMFYH